MSGVVLLIAGCTAPIGADRVTTREAYAQVEGNALRSGQPSAGTVSIIHRHSLDEIAKERPDEAVRLLHEKALATGERDMLFALSELSYSAGDHIRRRVKPWDRRDPRDYYLGSAIYAWLFLFGDGKDEPPGPFDRRFRDACDLYNYSLGQALTVKNSTNGIVDLSSMPRQLPVGSINFKIAQTEMASRLNESAYVMLADQLRVRGLSVRNRKPGLGAPIFGVRKSEENLGLHGSFPATAFLRLPGSLTDLTNTQSVATLELYSPFEVSQVKVGHTDVPLEHDLTTYRAYVLSQATIWNLGKLDFLAPAEHVRSQLLLNQPFEPDRIPVVFVHGTFSSPVTWAEMANTLTADPVLQKRYQIWSFIYGSGNPLIQSIAELREALTTQMRKVDPLGTNQALQQMVVIGHSQGGLLTKATAVSAGDRLWQSFSTNRFDDIKMEAQQREQLRTWLFLEPLPFVKRVVFIATPHRGSYLSSSFARNLARKFVALPQALATRSKDMLAFSEGSEIGSFLRGRVPTSLDGMSPENPGLLAMAELPVAPGIRAHSVIPVQGEGNLLELKDGVVAYESAHVGYVDSEFVVQNYHSCLDNPAAIEEVRRILQEHLRDLK